MVIELEKELDFEGLTKEGIALVDFNATWCGPCRMLKPVFEEASNADTSVKFIGVDVDKFGALAGRFNVRAVPTLVLLKDGKIVDIKTGFMPKESLLALVNKAK